MIIDVSDRNKAVALASGVVSYVAGMWTGVWSVPTRALDVPTSTQFVGGQMEYSAAYQPVPTWLPIASLLVIGIGFLAARRIAERDDDLELDDIDRRAAELNEPTEVESDD